MFRRRSHDLIAPPSETIPATDGRAISFVPGYENDPEQPAVVSSRYPVTGMVNGVRTIRSESIMARTRAENTGNILAGDLSEILLLMGEELEGRMVDPTNRAGRAILEYPRARREEPTRGAVYMLGPKLMRYDFVEDDDGITITGSGVVESSYEEVHAPVGTRVTTAVSMDERDRDTLLKDDGLTATEPTPEQVLVQQIRTAIGTYRTLTS